MKINKLIWFCALSLFLTVPLSAEAYWKTLFAYNNVEQIAMTEDRTALCILLTNRLKK